MIQHICKQCLASFEHQSSKRLFCSNECYYKSRTGKLQSQSCVEKRRQTMIGMKYSEERRKNIGLSRVIKLTEDKIIELKSFLDFGMPDGYVMAKTNLSVRVYKRYKKILYPTGIPWQIKWLENDIEKCVVEEVIRLTKLKYRYKRIANLLGIGMKTVRLIINALNKRDSDIKIYSYDETSWSVRKESGIEKEIREFLENRNIEHRQEAQIDPGSKWFFDFHIVNTNLLIEVQGDYWHCNPVIYKKPINEYQYWAIKRDFMKKNYAKNLGYIVLPIWENDLKINKNEVYSVLERAINKCKMEP